MTPDSNGYLSHKQILVVMGGLMVGMFLSALDQSIVGTALPRITSDLGGLDKLSWVVTAYMLAATASTPLWGKISDLYGRKLLFQIAIITFLVGSLLAGWSHNIEELIAFRAIQGLGGGGLMALAMATIGDVIPPRERGRYQGYFAAVFGTSSVLGPVLGGWFADGPGWQWIFFMNIPIGLVALVVTSAALKMPHVRRNHSIDYLGAAVVVASVSSFLLYTAWAGPDLGWTSGTSLALLAAGVLLAALFVFVENRAAEPIIPMRLFGNSIFSIANLFGFLIGIAMFGSMIFIPVYLQVVDGMSPTKSGLAMVPMVIGIFTTSITAGQLMSRNGRYKIYPILGATIVIGALVMLSSLTRALAVLVRRSVDVRPGRRPRLHHAGADHGRAELRGPQRHGRRDQLGGVLPADGRLVRHRAVRRDPVQPTHRAHRRLAPGRAGRPGPGERRRRGEQRAGHQGPAGAGAHAGHRGVQLLAARRVPVRGTPRGGGPAGRVLPQGEAARDPRHHTADGRRPSSPRSSSRTDVPSHRREPGPPCGVRALACPEARVPREGPRPPAPRRRVRPARSRRGAAPRR